MVNARLTWDSNAGRVGRGPMPKVTYSLWRETADNRVRPLGIHISRWLSFANQVFVPHVDAIAEVSRCGHSRSMTAR